MTVASLANPDERHRAAAVCADVELVVAPNRRRRGTEQAA
jgi:hypothetical protein